MVILTVRHYITCTDRIMESICAAIRSADPQCNAGMQSISKTDAAAALAERGHFEHSL